MTTGSQRPRGRAQKPHVIYVGWAGSPNPGDKAEKFVFATKAELDAFILGVESMDGWLGYEFFDRPARFNGTRGEWVERGG